MHESDFIEIVKKHGNMIHHICYSYCQSPDARSDLQQEILLQLWRSLQRFDGGVKISTWIYKVSLNVALSFHRDHKNRKETKIDENVIALPGEPESFIQREEIKWLYSFISNLNNLDKGLVLLYLDGYVYKEISEILGISETNVSTKMNRIKKILKSEFERVNIINNGSRRI